MGLTALFSSGVILAFSCAFRITLSRGLGGMLSLGCSAGGSEISGILRTFLGLLAAGLSGLTCVWSLVGGLGFTGSLRPLGFGLTRGLGL